MIPFGPLAPDAKETARGISLVAENVLPLVEGYEPFPQLVTPGGATALPAAPRGIVTVVKRDGTYQVYAFTAATLQSLGTDYTWTQIASGYNATSGDDWSSVHFGNQLLYSNTTDGLYAYDVEAGGAPSAITAAGDPRHVFTCSNMVIALDCLDDSSSRDNRLIRTSARGDHTNWTTREADYQSLEDGEELIAGVDLKNGSALIFQKNAMRLMQFGNVSGGSSFSLAKIADGRGSVGAKSVVSFDGVAYFLATNGFWRFSAEGLKPIGAAKIDRWFLDRVDQDDLENVQGSVDPYRKIVWWRYKASAVASETVFEDMIGYSWEFDRWVTSNAQTSYLSRIATPGYTLDSAAGFWSTLDDAPAIPVGDRFWQGGGAVFAALDSAFKYATFSGTAAAATLRTTTTNSPISGLIRSATPITDAQNGTLAIGVKDALYDSLTWKTGVGIKASGRCPVRARGKNIAFELDIAAGESWTYAKGVDHIEGVQGGPR